MHAYPRRVRALIGALIAAALAATLSIGLAGSAHAASYYNIINTDTGRALEVSVDGKFKLAPPNPNNMLQQFKRTNVTLHGNGQSEAIVDNRLLDCIRTPLNGPNPNLIGEPQLGICAPSDTRNRWRLKGGVATPNPGISGTQMKNVKSGEYLAEQFCLFGCPSLARPSLIDASLVESDPAQLGGFVKWQFKFAATAP
jgi:hypothetical protein